MGFTIAILFFQLTAPIQAVPGAIVAAADANVALVAKSTLAQPSAEPASGSESSPNGEASSVHPESSLTAERNAEVLSSIRIAEPISSQPESFIGVETVPSRRKWIAVSVGQHAAATFDAYSTRDAISHGAVEADPLMRPFANSSGIYAAIQLMPLALDYAGRRMQRSPNNFARHVWWVPQSVSAVSFVFSGVHNLHVAGER